MTESESIIRPIPHAVGIEKSVLSVLLKNAEAFDEAPHLTADHFYLPQHRLLFDLIRQHQTTTGKADMVAMIQEALSTGILDRLGGPGMITDIYTYAPVIDQYPAHVAQLGKFKAFRAAIEAAETIQHAAYNHDSDYLSESITSGTSAVLDALTDGQRAPTMREVALDSIDRFRQRVAGSSTTIGIITIPEIDKHLRGGHPGRLWVIGAYPEGGKSVIASQIVTEAALHGTPALFLSLEMPERDVMDRMIIQASRVDARAYTDPKEYARENGMESLPKGTILAIQRGVEKLQQSPLRIQRPANRKLATIIASIRRANREMGVKIAIVDYVQLIQGGAGHGTKEAEVSEISHALQECAGDTGVFIIILSQLNADGETKHGRVIEEDADAVIRIVQDRRKDSETYKAHRHVSIDKDRHNGSGGTRVPLILDRDCIRFKYGLDPISADKPEPPKFQR